MEPKTTGHIDASDSSRILPEPGTLVVLGHQNAHLMSVRNELRTLGWQILSAQNSVEALLHIGQQDACALLFEASMVPEKTKEQLLHLCDLDRRPSILVMHGESTTLSVLDLDLADHLLLAPTEARTINEIVQLVGATIRKRNEPGLVAAGIPHHSSTLAMTHQLVRACLTLTELENDRELLLTQVLESFVDLTQAGRASLMLVDREKNQLELVRRHGFPRYAPSEVVTKIDENYAGSVYVRGEPLLMELDPKEAPSHNRGYHGTSFLIMPLKFRGKTFGVVNLTNKRSGQSFGREDLEVAVMLANHAAANLANAETFADLHAMTVIDPLTHLYNRRHFDRELKKELERAKRHNRTLTLALLDIDKFKLFNDINGYGTGDAIIRQVGRILRDNFREVDIVTRWGGDEFAVLLPDSKSPQSADSHAPQNYIERVRLAVDGADFSQSVPEAAGRITLSAGVATYPTDCSDGSTLFRLANQALARAKRDGNNRTCCAHDL